MDAHFDDRWNQALFGAILERLNFSDLKIKKFIDNEVSTFAIAKKDSNLFKTEIYTKNIERAYKKVHQNYLDGIKPQNLEL